MNRFQTWTMPCVLSLVIFSTTQALGYTIEACVQPSQFQPAVCDTFTGSPPDLVAESDTLGNVTTAATAAPFQLTAKASTTNTGSALARARARFVDTAIVFEDAQALANMLTPGSNTLALQLHLALSVVLDTNDNPGSLSQAVATVQASITTSTVGFVGFKEGRASILNSPFDHTVTTSGLLTGLSEPGDSRVISLPVTMRPLAVGGSTLSIKAFVEVSSLALTLGFSDAAIELAVPEDTAVLTLADGTPLADVGVAFTLHPPTILQ